MGFVNQRVQLGLSELRGVDIVSQRQHASRRASFYHIGAVFEIEANRGPRLIRRIDDALRDSGFGMKSIADTAAGVAVPARGADRLGSNQHSRSNDLSALDGVPQPDV